jgi:hypothetical protein
MLSQCSEICGCYICDCEECYFQGCDTVSARHILMQVLHFLEEAELDLDNNFNMLSESCQVLFYLFIYLFIYIWCI